MKFIRKPNHLLRSTAAAVALAGSMSAVVAAEDILWTWDTEAEPEKWQTGWGPAVTEQDPSQDNTGNGGGALHITTDYGNDAKDQNVITAQGWTTRWAWDGDFGSLTNLAEFDRLEFDIKWDSATSTMSLADFNTPAAGGENGMAFWNMRRNGSDWQWVTLTYFDVPEDAGNGWAHVTIPIDITWDNLDLSAGITFKKWVSAETLALGGIASFWVDNVHLVAREAEIPPPTVKPLTTATEGLQSIASGGGQWQRQGLRTVGSNFHWLGSPTPTTYEQTVAEMPPSEYAGYNTYIYLVPNDPRSANSPDWNEPNVIRFDMSENDDGTFTGAFRFKTNSPSSNGPNNAMYEEWTLGSIDSTTGVGAWGFTITDDVNVTLYSPEGTSTNFVMPADVAALFTDVTAYLGSTPGDPARFGQKAVFSQFKITGAAGGVDLIDDFAGPGIDTNLWELAAEDSAGLMIVDEPAHWLSWTIPDTDFGPIATASLGAPDWQPVPAGSVAIPLGSGTRGILVNDTDLPGTDEGYFRLKKRSYTKLQILLPGETAAPGTPTGKTGTPDPQVEFEAFNVTVNAVADDWSLWPAANDTIEFSSTDITATLPFDATLVNGTGTFEVFINMNGTHTITVSNVSNPAIESDTSSEFVAKPWTP